MAGEYSPVENCGKCTEASDLIEEGSSTYDSLACVSQILYVLLEYKSQKEIGVSSYMTPMSLKLYIQWHVQIRGTCSFSYVFPFYTTLYYYSTTSQMQILYFLLHHICLTALVTSYFSNL